MASGPQQWFFDAWSRIYDLTPVQLAVYRPVQTAVIAALRHHRVKRLLDVGCGTGVLGARIRREMRSTSVVGLDFSAGMLERARARDGLLPLVRGDGGRLPFRDGAFDAVVGTESFHWFPDPDGALAEFRRVLRPSGRLLLALVNPRFALTGEIAHRASRLVGEPFHWPTAGELAHRLRHGGFRVERQERLFRFPGILVFPPMLTIARRLRS
jgi:ubiquinone/menaquinone biosynthesis C-methylase UbiE